MQKQVIILLLSGSLLNMAYGQGHISQWSGSSTEETNRKVLETMGYRPPVIPPSDPTARHLFITGSDQDRQQQQLGELQQLLREISRVTDKTKLVDYEESPKFKADLKNYQQAFILLRDMASGARPLSISDAFFLTEAAFGNLHFSYQEYRKNIAQSALFIRQWMQENNLALHHAEAVHYAIQKFMGEKLVLKNRQAHQPFIYDYIDYRGETDLRNYFLTKTLATGSGQCNTLPRVYLVLAEALNVNVYLSFAPMHSFIKYANNQGVIQNYETTIHWHMTDQDYMKEMPMMAAAIKNKVYLDTLNKQQIVASALVDLAYNFTREHWMADIPFINQCIDTALAYFEHGANSEALLLKSMVLAYELNQALAANGITALDKADTIPLVMEKLRLYQENEALIEALGIQNIPEEQYQAMLARHDQRGKLQQARGINTKAKKSLFSRS